MKRDKPLAFHFRAPEFDVRDLGLPLPRDDKHAQAQASTLLDLVLEAQWQDRDVSYSRRREWYAQPRHQGTAYTFDRVVPFVDRLAANLKWTGKQKAIFPTGQSALNAIRRKCIDCTAGNSAEISRCEMIDCALWPFRMGKNPFHGNAGKPQPNAFKTSR